VSRLAAHRGGRYVPQHAAPRRNVLSWLHEWWAALTEVRSAAERPWSAGELDPDAPWCVCGFANYSAGPCEVCGYDDQDAPPPEPDRLDDLASRFLPFTSSPPRPSPGLRRPRVSAGRRASWACLPIGVTS